MLKVIFFSFIIITVYGHTSDKLQSDTELQTGVETMSPDLNPPFAPELSKSEADLQEALMPQELNPVFVPDLSKDKPWRASLPFPLRTRRFAELQDEVQPGLTVTLADQLKRYSRIVTVVVLALSAVTEIVLYIIDASTSAA